MTAPADTRRDTRRAVAAVAVAIGIGLALAPLAFGMFTRAPGGGRMLDGFRPFMTQDTIDGFRGHLDVIGAAAAEDPDQPELGATAAFTERWPHIDAEMGDMLTTMERSVDNFAAVDALPPFGLFPFFFVLPGLFLAAAGVWYLRTRSRSAIRMMAAVAVGLVAAPFVFQMFARAPKGGEMIDDFRPMMTTANVQEVQGYFLVIGAGEGELRTRVLPTAAPDAFPATRALAEAWPAISNEMAPMIGAMSDNVSNFQGVDAMPPFPLFPWFFVIPGTIVVGLIALTARRSGRRLPVPSTAVLLVVALLAGACGGGDEAATSDATAGEPLAGLFAVNAGHCAEGGVQTGSWFRMVQSGGSAHAGPFVPNGDSPCGDKSWTPLTAGSDGGLRTGGFQPQPEPPFDAKGNSASGAVVAPVKWFAVSFGLATNKIDPQTGKATSIPVISADGATLTGDLSAMAASWNGQHFNQGAPKPGAPTGPKPTGSFDAKTGRYNLDWTSLIEGGPFNGFTGVWHLEGSFTAA